MGSKRKIGRWTVGIVLTPFLVVLLLTGTLYLPPVQQWAIGKVCRYVSAQTGMQVRLQRIRLTPLLDLDLQEFAMTTPPDTVVAVKHLVADLDLGGILKGRVGVDALKLQEGTIDTRDLIATVRVKGQVGSFVLAAPSTQDSGILLKEQCAHLTKATLDGCDVDIALRDTTVTDTTESAPIPWDITLQEIVARQTRVAFHTVGDSICIRGGVRMLALSGCDVNLAKGIYKATRLNVEADSLRYDLLYEPEAENVIDYNHLVISNTKLKVENLYFNQASTALTLRIKECSTRERCGLEIKELAGHISLDNTHIQIPDLHLTMAHSRADGHIDLDWEALSAGRQGNMEADLEASVGRQDLLLLAAPYLTPQQQALIPPTLTLSAKATGNLDNVTVERCRLQAPPLANADVTGTLSNILDEEHRICNLDVNLQTADLHPLHHMLGLPAALRLPHMALTGKVGMSGPEATANLMLRQGTGTARLKGTYHTRTEAYNASLDVRNLNLHNFLPKDSLYTLTATATVSGKGLDLLSPKCRAQAEASIQHLQYGQRNIDNIQLTGNVNNGLGLINLYSNNDLLVADACANLTLDRKITNVDVSLAASHIDLYGLGVTDKPLTISMTLQADGSSNLSDTHRLKGNVRTITLDVPEGIFYPSDIDLDVLMTPDTLKADIASGDFDLRLLSRNGLAQTSEKATLFYDELKRQLKAHTIEQDTLKSLLPDLTLQLRSGKENTVAKIVETMGYSYDRISLDVDCNPQQGLHGKGHIYGMNTGAVMLDTIQLRAHQDTTNVVRMEARVKNGPRNRQVVFEGSATAELTPTGANATLAFYDAKGNKGVDLGAQLMLEEDGYRLHLHPLAPIIAYRRFTLNKDNYIQLHDNNRVEADIDLLADDGTGLKLYSTPNDDALQDITLSIHDFNVGELSSAIPYMPAVGGMLAGDFHLVQDSTSMSVLIDAALHDFTYEGTRMGDMGLNAVYLPNQDGTHYVDGIVSHDGLEVMTLAGTYSPEGEGNIDAQATLQRLPLTLANGFIPDQMATLAGYVTGELDVTGTVARPILNGAVATDSMHLASDMYSLRLRFPNDTIGVKQGNLSLDRIEAYSTGKNPLVLDGAIDLSDLNRIGLNLTLTARDFELINAPKSQRAVAYGKVFVDANARLTGTLDDIMLRGRLNVLGNTDVTYVLTDSPLTADDQLAELVTFTDFADTLQVAEQKQTSPQNIDMALDISIEQAAQAHCLLSADGTNRIDLEGGGDLSMTYTSQDGTKMYGRYTIVSGVMNYSLMVMSLKNFAIQNGSYAEFTGDMANPRLSISASERVKTTVYEDNTPRSVSFDVGLKVSQTLEDMGLEFTLEAPGDMTISNQLASMTTEERGKVAVTMLATGMYLTESGNGTSGFSATNALNSFLQTQIAAISNKALSTIDLNFGIDNTDTASGGTQTDYSFSFAKRFWGNRISLIVGGKVSSGSEAQNTAQSLIDNISIEYRLDKGATRYVRLYYDRDTESLLEGDITEMGAGVVFRKKSTRLGDLFLFKK